MKTKEKSETSYKECSQQEWEEDNRGKKNDEKLQYMYMCVWAYTHLKV